jgi:glycosyltransferase involved in cell wall biosynthesis
MVSLSQIQPHKGTQYPKVEPVADGIVRPLWSVMIPTYNGAAYLEETLRCVLAQDPGAELMQIEVIDDCSTEGDSEGLVQAIGQGRVQFFRQPQNVGLIGNWNACIERSRGHWVHILHQDDLVLPGFYQQLQSPIHSQPALGALFCRHAFIDEDGHWQGLSSIEQKNPGILPNWLERIAVVQLIQFPSMVVKRSAYEQLGGFCADVHYAADWEMWKRISAHYPIWYEPQILACYRIHAASETSRMVQSGADIVDIRKAIEMSKAYLPEASADQLSQQAKEHYALYAINTAKRLVLSHDAQAAMTQVREALRCSLSISVWRSLFSLLRLMGKQWIGQKRMGSERS